MTSHVLAFQYVNYDSRTDVIDPIGKVHFRQFGGRYEVRKPLVGWGSFTHLIQPESGGWVIAQLTPAEAAQ